MKSPVQNLEHDLASKVKCIHSSSNKDRADYWECVPDVLESITEDIEEWVVPKVCIMCIIINHNIYNVLCV